MTFPADEWAKVERTVHAMAWKMWRQHRHSLPYTDAEDLEQVGLLAAYRSLPKHDPDKAASLYTFAVNAAKWNMIEAVFSGREAWHKRDGKWVLCATRARMPDHWEASTSEPLPDEPRAVAEMVRLIDPYADESAARYLSALFETGQTGRAAVAAGYARSRCAEVGRRIVHQLQKAIARNGWTRGDVAELLGVE